MKKTTQTKKLKKVIKGNPEGFTVKYTTLKPIENKTGYAVSITNIKGKYLNPLMKKVLFIATGFKQIEKNLYIGGWRENKTFYLDLTLILKDKKTAIQTGKLFNQIALFNLFEFKEINLK